VKGRGGEGREKEGKGKVASWLLGDGRPCLMVLAWRAIRDVTCHRRSQSVTCCPTQVIAPPNPNPQAGTRFTYHGGTQLRKAELTLGYPAMKRPGVELATSRS